MRTVLSVLRDLFPTVGDTGSGAYMRFPDADYRHPTQSYANAPILPFDVFAVTGHLLELSGAYHHIVSINREADIARRLDVTAEHLKMVRGIAKSWRAYDPRKFTDDDEGRTAFEAWLALDEAGGVRTMRDMWAAMISSHAQEVIFAESSHHNKCPDWWHLALMLFVSADEAARGAGFNPVEGAPRKGQEPSPWFEKIAYETFFIDALAGQNDKTEIKPIITFSAADPDILCVLPKARTPSVGCTMRSLSHNLALLPPRGIAKGGWMPFLFQTAPPDEMHMNILLVPFPFKIRSIAFQPKISEATEGQSSGVFSLKQEWLDKVTSKILLDFIAALETEATKEIDRLHAIVFPEMALNRELYEELVVHLPNRLPGIELLISGISEDQSGRHGNFVSMTVFQKDGGDPKSSPRPGLTFVREKHHRWRLDGQQIVAYGLEGVMSASVGWWEDLDLLSRRVDFAVLRSGSVVSTMICEDLARVDPCQQLIRAVGPSIIFALLMDAPQLKARWPSRHATTLAEDPGSAVLTLTSKGLMDRQHRLRIHESKGEQDRVVALWRDDSQADPIEICCPDENYAVVVRCESGRQDLGRPNRWFGGVMRATLR